MNDFYDRSKNKEREPVTSVSEALYFLSELVKEQSDLFRRPFDLMDIFLKRDVNDYSVFYPTFLEGLREKDLRQSTGDMKNCQLYLIFDLLDFYGILSVIKRSTKFWKELTDKELYFIVQLVMHNAKERRIESERKNTKNKNELGAWHFIPSDRYYFTRTLLKILAKNPEISSFFDVGSGTGEKPLIAYLSSNQIKNSGGLEITRHTYELSKMYTHDYFSQSRFRVIEATNSKKYVGNGIASGLSFSLFKRDLFKFAGLHEWDLIYTYCPANNHRLLKEMYTKILTDMKVGSILWEIHPLGELDRALNEAHLGVKRLEIQRYYKDNIVYIKKIASDRFKLEFVDKWDN